MTGREHQLTQRMRMPGKAGRRASVLAALLCTLIAQSAVAQSQADVVSRTEILGALSVVNTQSMDFGDLIVPAAGRVDMTASASATCTPNNGITHLGVCQAAGFSGVAAQGLTIRVQVPFRRRFELTGPGKICE